MDFNKFAEQAEKFCLIHNEPFEGKHCPKCEAQHNPTNDPNTKDHPADCECSHCISNKWFDANTPL